MSSLKEKIMIVLLFVASRIVLGGFFMIGFGRVQTSRKSNARPLTNSTFPQPRPDGRLPCLPDGYYSMDLENIGYVTSLEDGSRYGTGPSRKFFNRLPGAAQ